MWQAKHILDFPEGPQTIDEVWAAVDNIHAWLMGMLAAAHIDEGVIMTIGYNMLNVTKYACCQYERLVREGKVPADRLIRPMPPEKDTEENMAAELNGNIEA